MSKPVKLVDLIPPSIQEGRIDKSVIKKFNWLDAPYGVGKKLKLKMDSEKRYGEPSLWVGTYRDVSVEFKGIGNKAWRASLYDDKDLRGGVDVPTSDDKKNMKDYVVNFIDKYKDGELLSERKGAGGYEIYHKSFTSAASEAIQVAKKKGFEVDEDDWFRQVASGPRKPGKGKTNSYTVDLTKNGKPVRRKLAFQVYGMESGTYELNAYLS